MKTTSFFLLLGVGVALLCLEAVAQDGVNGSGLKEGRAFPWLEHLREENPEEYERLKDLREADPEAFQLEIRKRLADRRNKTSGNQGRWGNRSKTKRFGDAPLMFEKLRNENPEEFERLMRLREEKPQVFLQELRKMTSDKGTEEDKCHELSRLYHDTEDPAEKERVKAELREVVLAAFDARIELHRRRLVEVENRLAGMRKKLEEREAGRTEVCEERLRELTKNPTLNWESGW